MAEITFNGVEKVYHRGVRAVSDLTLQVADGELLVLVGPSGCGKSTTLRMVAGLEDVTSGTISISSRVVNDVPAKDRNVAMVFQDRALYPQMTVYQNMAFGLKLRKLAGSEIDTRIQSAAETLGLAGLLDRRPAALSGGQRQRVALGRAIVRQPDTFLLDEPLSNLDARLREQMRVEIGRLHNRLGTTMLYVTHDQAEAITLGDRVVVLDRGVVQQVDDPGTLYNSPANRFVAGFIGTPQMNFLTGRITLQNDTLVFRSEGALELPVPEPKRRALGAYLDREVIVGVRPEHVVPAAEQSSNASGIPATVELIEPMGAETYVYLTTGASRLVSRVAPQSELRAGRQTVVALRVDNSHFFDPISETAIT